MFELDPAFIKPTYDSRCFTAIPQSIAGLLGHGQIVLPPELLSRPPQNVPHRSAHSAGWLRLALPREGRRRIIPRCAGFSAADGVAKLTAQFPSTTAAHVTCLHTGLEVGQSGVYEWQYYEPQLDAMITPLLFSLRGNEGTGSAQDDRHRPSAAVSLGNALSAAGETRNCVGRTPASRVYAFHLL